MSEQANIDKLYGMVRSLLKPAGLQLHDINEFSPDNRDGMHSVSEGKIFYGRLSWMSLFAVPTVCCVQHGACNAMTNWQDGKILWRCQACHEGAISHPSISKAGSKLR